MIKTPQAVRAAILLAGCAHGATSRPVSGLEPHRAPPSVAAIVDTEEDVWPDPVIRTRFHISEAQHLLTRYCESHGRYPDSLRDALPTSRSEWVTIYDFDAWGRPLLYTSSGAEYEFRSVGADGHGSTADDIVGTAERLLVPDALAPELQQHNPCAQR